MPEPFLVIGTPEVGPPRWSYVKSVLGLNIPGPWLFHHSPGYGGVDEACNNLAEFFLDTPAEWLFLVASDATLHPDTVLRLLSWNKPLVSALAFVRHLPLLPALHITSDPSAFTDMVEVITEWIIRHPKIIAVNRPVVLNPRPEDALLRTHKSGLHASLIHRSVLETVDQPWFRNTDAQRGGEDYYFTDKAREAGFTSHIDLSVVAGHAWGDWSIGALEFMIWGSVTDWDASKIRVKLGGQENGTND